MPAPVYFETSTVLELINSTAKSRDVRDLMAELRREKTRIYTSILTVQEASILSFRHGKEERDIYSYVGQFARIYTIDRAVAIAAAKLEAGIQDFLKSGEGMKDEARHRRRWDCLHIASAQVLGCSALYAYDADFFKRSRQVNVGNLRILPPKPLQPQLDLQSNLKLIKR